MAYLSLGDLRWRIDPQSFHWNYSIDTNVIQTLGGQVVQILGATLSDITIVGQFGQDRPNRQESWQLAVAFHRRIQAMMDAQVLPASSVKVGNTRGNLSINRAVHQPFPLRYQDGVHDWSFTVLIKSISDPDGSGALEHRTGKFSYSYVLTLFVVEAGTDQLVQAAQDDFIARLSKGLGWKQSRFNGTLDAAQLQTFVQAAGAAGVNYTTGVSG